MKLRQFSDRFLLRLESSRWFFFASIFFRCLLEIAYLEFVNPLFEYAGFVLDVDYFKYIESWFLWIFLVLIFPKRLEKSSDYFMSLLLFSYLTPLLAFYGLTNSSREHLYTVVFGVILIVAFRKGRSFKPPFVKHGPFISYSILFLGALVTTAWMLMSGGTDFFNLDLTRVYEFREDVDEVINQGPMGYLNTWATKVFGPALLAIALWKRKFWIALAVFGLHVFWFGVSANKGVLFYPFLVTFLWIWFTNSKALALIPLGMSLPLIFSLFLYLVFENMLLGSLLVRRAFFVPSHLTFVYYEFFSQHQFVYWSESITSQFIRYPYAMASPKVIGDYLGSEAHANNSFLATGYMHAGIFGVILYGVLVGLLFRLIDSLSSKKVPAWVAAALLAAPLRALLTSVDLPTALLTHGVGISIVVIFLLRSAHYRQNSVPSQFYVTQIQRHSQGITH